ncbi:MAG: NAD(P)H-dependent oxidoreductase [Schaedlerella sp.]|nr:NAD(P)H-dependent oxidoreductase [Schaedlerella sp.]
MKLIIHDLMSDQVDSFNNFSLSETNTIIIDSSIQNHFCTGCFGCWLKTPGRCVIKDTYQSMGENLSRSDELLIISKATFGSYSSSVKNVLDRSISYVQPFFVIRKGEMHHKERYHKNLKISAIFYGADITEKEKETSRNLVAANALNLNGTVGSVRFVDTVERIREVLG